MLSRIAESLFWTGRYVERADDMARILDVHLHHLLEDPTVDESTACSALLAAMGVAVGDTAPDAASVTEKLAFDDTNPSSIVSSLVAARANARGISEVISSEMWEALNVTYNALGIAGPAGPAGGPARLLRVRQGTGRVAGRPGRFDHVQGRCLAFPRFGSEPGTGRHAGSPAFHRGG